MARTIPPKMSACAVLGATARLAQTHAQQARPRRIFASRRRGRLHQGQRGRPLQGSAMLPGKRPMKRAILTGATSGIGEGQCPAFDCVGSRSTGAPVVVGCSTDTGSDAGKVSLRASSSASSRRRRSSLSRSSRSGTRFGSAITSIPPTVATWAVSHRAANMRHVRWPYWASRWSLS